MNRERALEIFAGFLDACDRCEYSDYFYDHSIEMCEAIILAAKALELEAEMELII